MLFPKYGEDITDCDEANFRAYQRPPPKIEELSFQDRKKVALRLGDKHEIKMLQKLEQRKQKALEKVNKFNGFLTEEDKKELGISTRAGDPTYGVDPEKFALKKKQDKDSIRKLEAVQEAERRRHPQRKPFLEQSSSRSSKSLVDITSLDNRYEIYDKDGHLINVNGICLGLDGKPIWEEIRSKKGHILMLNDQLASEIKGLKGCVRYENGALMSLRGAPFREEVRNPEGRLIAINGKRINDNREDIDLAVQTIIAMSRNRKRSALDKLLVQFGGRTSNMTLRDTFMRRIEDEVKSSGQKLIQEAKRAKKMDTHNRAQEKADMKAHDQEKKNEAKLLEKELIRKEKELIRHLEKETKETKSGRRIEFKLPTDKLKAHALRMAGKLFGVTHSTIEEEQIDTEKSEVNVTKPAEKPEKQTEDDCSSAEFPSTVWKQGKLVTEAKSTAKTSKGELLGSDWEDSSDEESDDSGESESESDSDSKPGKSKFAEMLEYNIKALDEFNSSGFERESKHFKEAMENFEVTKQRTERQKLRIQQEREENKKKRAQQHRQSIDEENKRKEQTKEDKKSKYEHEKAKKLLKHQEKMAKIEEKHQLKEDKKMDKEVAKHHKKKLNKLKAKDKEHEKVIAQKAKDMKKQEKEFTKEWKDSDNEYKKVTKEHTKKLKKKYAEMAKEREKLRKEEEKLKKEELATKKKQQKEDKERLGKVQEAQKQEEKEAKAREKEIRELEKMSHKRTVSKDKKYQKMLDKDVQRENKERLEKIKLQEKKEKREGKQRSKEIAELEKLRKKQAAKDLARALKDRHVVYVGMEEDARQEMKEREEFIKQHNKEVREKDKEIRAVEREQAKLARKELQRLQKEGRVEERKAAKEKRLELRRMKAEQARADKEAKWNAKEMERMEKEKERLAKKEAEAQKREEQIQFREEKMEMEAKLREMEKEKLVQEKDAEGKMKLIAMMEKEQEKEAVKEMERLKKEGKIQEKRMEKEMKTRLRKLKSEKRMQETEAKKQQREIERMEADECKRAEKELERIKKEGKYKESKEARDMRERLKKLKAEQKKKEKEDEKRQKEKASLEKIEREIMVQQALLLTDAEQLKKIDETLAMCKETTASKNRLKEKEIDLINDEIDYETKAELHEISGDLRDIFGEQSRIQQQKDDLKTEGDDLETKEQEIQGEVDTYVEDLSGELQSKVQHIRRVQNETVAKVDQLKEAAAERKRQYADMMEEFDRNELVIEELVKENVPSDHQEKIEKYRVRKEELNQQIEEARLKLKSQHLQMEDLNEQEQDLKDEEDDILLNESGDMTELMEVKMNAADCEHKEQEFETEIDAMLLERGVVSQEIHEVAAREEVLMNSDQTDKVKEELQTVRREGVQNKEIHEKIRARISNLRLKMAEECRQKQELEIKAKELIENKVTEEGQNQLRSIKKRIEEIHGNKRDLKVLVEMNNEKAQDLKKDLVTAQKDEDVSIFKVLNKEAQNEYQRLKDLQMKQQKGLRKNEKELFKSKKEQRKASKKQDAFDKKEIKLLEKEATKENKLKIKKLKEDRKDQREAKKQQVKKEKVLLKHEMKMKKNEQSLKAKEEKILGKALKKETAVKVKELKKQYKEKERLEKQLEKEVKALQKAKETKAKQQIKEDVKILKMKDSLSKLDKLQRLQQEYEKLKTSRDEEVVALETKINKDDEEILVVENQIHQIQQEEIDNDQVFDGSINSGFPGKSDVSKVIVTNKSNVAKFIDTGSNFDSSSGDESRYILGDQSEVERSEYVEVSDISNDDESDLEDVGEKVKKEKKKEKKENPFQRRLKKLRIKAMSSPKDAKKLKKECKKLDVQAKKEKKALKKKLELEEKHELKLHKMAEKNEKEMMKEVAKHGKKLMKNMEKEQKKQMALEKKAMKYTMKEQLKPQPATNNMAAILGKEIMTMFQNNGNMLGKVNKGLLVDPMKLVQPTATGKGADVIKEMCRNVMLHKFENYDSENLVLKNEIKTLRFALEACNDKNNSQLTGYEERIQAADAEIKELEQYRDNAEMLVQQVNAMHQQLHYMVNPSEYEKMERRVNMLNRKILKFKGERDYLYADRHRLDEQNDELKMMIKIEKQHKYNSDERLENETRMCNAYREKFLALEKKFDEQTQQSINEQRRILFEYGYRVKDNVFQDKSQTVQDLKDRVVKLELVVKEKEKMISEMGSVERKEEHARSMLKEVELQMKRMNKSNTMYLKEERTLNRQYEVQADRALKNRIKELKVFNHGPSKEAFRDCQKLKKELRVMQKEKQGLQRLIDEKDHVIKTMTSSMKPGHVCKPDGLRGERNCKYCNEGTHLVSERMREKLMFPYHQHAQCQPRQQKIASQIVVNPDVKIPTLSQIQRLQYESYVKNNKRQLFRIQEVERAAKILYKEIQDRFSEEDDKKGKPMVEQLAHTMVSMMMELKDFAILQNVCDDKEPEKKQDQSENLENKTRNNEKLASLKERLRTQERDFELELKATKKIIETMKVKEQENQCSLDEAREQVEKDKQIKERQRSMLGKIQKQRDDLQSQLNEDHKATPSPVTLETKPTPKMVAQGVQTDKEPEKKVVVATQANEDLKKELQELKERNETLEEYYEENSRKSNEVFKQQTENKNLKKMMEDLQNQLKMSQEQNKELQAKVYEQEETIKNQPACTDKDHLCFTVGCEKHDEATQKPSNPEIEINETVQSPRLNNVATEKVVEKVMVASKRKSKTKIAKSVAFAEQSTSSSVAVETSRPSSAAVKTSRPSSSAPAKKKPSVPLWMQWDEKKEETSENEDEEEDGQIIEREPKQKARFGRRQAH
ncbi:trichohyalin-like isoform X2 [Clytia hemisphaerica]|uniref:trichohyalin-like isoform X2 n=1 Tax=Clytia hemisphaerica TaxID=252671 RepID=UPI0034D5C72D